MLPCCLSVTHSRVVQSGRDCVWSSLLVGRRQARPVRLIAQLGCLRSPLSVPAAWATATRRPLRFRSRSSCWARTAARPSHTWPAQVTTVRSMATAFLFTPLLLMCAGPTHSAVVSRDGRLFTFGSGSAFELGNGKPTAQLRPTVGEHAPFALFCSLAILPTPQWPLWSRRRSASLRFPTTRPWPSPAVLI